VRAERAKQLLKNGVYRTIGETTATLSPRNGAADSRLRVLMYHKVNDLPENPLSVPSRSTTCSPTTAKAPSCRRGPC
jgi:hypothetical protein